MATRDPNIISELLVPTIDGVAVVRETKEGDESKFKLVNPGDIPAGMHNGLLAAAKTYEEKPKKK